MHFLVVHNPKAGLDHNGGHTLVHNIEAAGHTTTLISAKDKTWDITCDAIAVAGGDGTLETVLHHVGKANIPLVIVPQGTANNVANSLGIQWTDETKTSFWRSLGETPPITNALSIGRVCYGQHEKLFIESIGCGLLAYLIAADKGSKTARKTTFGSPENELKHRVVELQDALQHYEAEEYSLRVDGQDYSGRYLMIEAMNISRVGPGLALAPEADAGDDTLEVVLVGHHEKELLSHYLAEVAQGGQPKSPFTRVPGRHIELRCNASELHVDDQCLRKNLQDTFAIRAAVQQLNVLNWTRDTGA